MHCKKWKQYEKGEMVFITGHMKRAVNGLIGMQHSVHNGCGGGENLGP